MKQFFLMSAVFLLFSCGSIGTQFKAFKEPADGDRARVRVVGNSLVKAVPGKSCVDWSTPGAGTVLGGIVGSSGFRDRSLGMPPSLVVSGTGTTGVNVNFGAVVTVDWTTTPDTAEFYVEAGKPITLMLLTTPETNRRCSITVSFVPEKDKNYEAVMVHRYGVCSADVFSIDYPAEAVETTRTGTCR